ncbi:hypothetical protein K6119_01805 [Paracrocinitomix mangrovi]|uniref:hypothetical protein n=1 Tax=Paracrocinitomix mangrovi TaxID=2862509 RepID=UPI001C8EDE8C|nr:hypothetical protein [Paracrocinitomix mangrovi]UKN02252.1 hypothetical protein K6119_01805 [Paracrocinitomix mangrovi]
MLDLLIMNGTNTYATTNLSARELEKPYRNKVRSRLSELFNLISFVKEQYQVNADEIK